MAAKARMATTVAPSSGHAVCDTTSDAACLGSVPRCILISIPSTTTMALSTNIPSAMMSAPSETRSSARPFVPMRTNVPAMVSNRMNPMSKPLRSPMKINNTTMTIATAWMRLTMNPLMAAVTSRDWSEMMPNSIPSGSEPWSSRSRTSSASPIVTTLPPATVEIATPYAS